MFLKRAFAIILCIAIMAVGFCGCSETKSDKPTVITTLFPQYDFVRQLAGDNVDLVFLLPPGTESHSYDPTAKDIQKITQCDLFIYTGDDMEPWVSSVVASAEKLNILDLSKGISLIAEDHDHEEPNEEHHHQNDPHIWLNLQNSVKMVQSIEKELVKICPNVAEKISANAKEYCKKLSELDGRFEKTVKDAGEKYAVFGGRFAYAYFIERYCLKYKTVFDGCSTEVEPGAKRVEEITNFIKTNNIKYVFHEELADPKVARSVAEATGASLLEFSTAHNLSQADFDKGVTFLDIMQKNCDNLKLALG